MAIRRGAWTVSLFSVMLLGVLGCATTDPEQPFSRVKQQIRSRSGAEIEWQRTNEAKKHLYHRIRTMLADGLTLNEAVAIGLANNRRIQGVYQELGIAQAGVAQAQLLDNPYIGFAYMGGPTDAYKLELQAVANIMSLFLMPLRQALAEARLARAEHRVAGLVLTHIFQIQEAYVMLQGDQASFDLLKRVLSASEAAYEMAQRMREAGNITRLELLSRKSLADEDRLALSSASLGVTQSRERLNRLLGLWGSHVNWQVKAALAPIPKAEPEIADVEKRAVEASVDMALSRSKLMVAARQLGITNVTSIIPQLGVGAAFEREVDGTWLGGPALELEVPLFDPGHAKRSRAHAIMERHWEEFTALAVVVRSQARQARRRLAVAREQALYYEDTFLPLRKTITQQAQRRYNGMFLGVFELLMIKRMELRASLGYIAALENYWRARFEMEEILSGKLPEHTKPMENMMPFLEVDTGQWDH